MAVHDFVARRSIRLTWSVFHFGDFAHWMLS